MGFEACNGNTGSVGGNGAFVVAILEASQFYETGIGSLHGCGLDDKFFEHLHISELEEPGPWIIEVQSGKWVPAGNAHPAPCI